MTTPIDAAEAAHMLNDLTAVVVEAMEAIQAVPAFKVPHRLKTDHTPVTAADEASEAAILAGLRRMAPHIPVLSEESFSRSPDGYVSNGLGTNFFAVDPLDGTREFLAGLDEYAVNVALIVNGIPIAGVVAAPARGIIWRGADGRAERLQHFGRRAFGDAVAIKPRAWPSHDARAMVSRSHLDGVTDAYLSHMPVVREPCGSSIKFCRLAEGSADIYPRFGPTSEWDIAAGHAILLAAGGLVTGPARAPLHYGKADNRFIVPAFIAWGDINKAAEKQL